ncbi:MAG: Rho termination factor N-terminal domain-containing protein [Bacilli bacterium]
MSDFKEVSYHDMNLNELRELAKEKGIKGYSKLTKEELIDQLED